MLDNALQRDVISRWQVLDVMCDVIMSIGTQREGLVGKLLKNPEE